MYHKKVYNQYLMENLAIDFCTDFIIELFANVADALSDFCVNKIAGRFSKRR